MNVILVVLDTARADALEPYGAARGASPALADIARRGGAVDHAYSTSNWTLPAHVSMFTGDLAARHGMRLTALGTPADMAANIGLIETLAPHSLPDVLRRAGWQTRAASANPWISPSYGFGDWFDDFETVTGTRHHAAPIAPEIQGSGARHQLARARAAVATMAEAVRAQADDGAAELSSIARRWIASQERSRPFFWFFNLLECHSPYLPPRRDSALGPVGRAQLAHDHLRYGSLGAIGRANCGLLDIDDAAARRMRRAYRGAVHAADRWVGSLLEELDRHRLLDETMVVVTSDHGENLGESGRIAHAIWLDDRLIRVPLVFMGPKGLDTSRVTSLADLPALITRAVELSNDEAWPAGASWQGTAVAQAEAAVLSDDPRLETMRDEVDAYAMWRMTTGSTCATDGRLKLVREGHDDWLYDLAVDPAEVSPTLIDARSVLQHGAAVQRLRSAVDRAPIGRHGSGASAAATVGPADPDLTARMRMLGYL
jgi:arylsulfatase A-like enzyme